MCSMIFDPTSDYEIHIRLLEATTTLNTFPVRCRYLQISCKHHLGCNIHGFSLKSLHCNGNCTRNDDNVGVLGSNDL